VTLHKITEFYTECFSVCPGTTSKFLIIDIFKSFIKQNIDSNKIPMTFYGSKLHFSKCNRPLVACTKRNRL